MGSNSFSFDLVVTSSIYPVIKTQHGHSQNIPCCSLFSKDRLIRNKKYFEFNKTSLKTQLISFSAKYVDIVLCVNFEVMQNDQKKVLQKSYMRCRFQSESNFANSKCVFFIQMKQ